MWRKFYKAKATKLFVVRAVGRIMPGPSVCKIIRINPGFRFGLSKNKNIDHLVKETYPIMSTQVTKLTSPNRLLLSCTTALRKDRRNDRQNHVQYYKNTSKNKKNDVHYPFHFHEK